MKKLLLILIMFSFIGAKAQVETYVCTNFDFADTTFTFKTSSYGYNSYFIETDTVYGSTKDATIEILQGYDTLRPVRVDGGLLTLNDIMEAFRLIKSYTPKVFPSKITNQIKLTKNTMDSTKITIVRIWHPL